MSILFSSRAGMSVTGGGVLSRSDWPLGSVTLEADAIAIGGLLSSYRLSFADIERIRPGFLDVIIEHHAPGVPSRVRVWGIRLFRRLCIAIEQHELAVKITS